jgi:hypothetical protein
MQKMNSGTNAKLNNAYKSGKPHDMMLSSNAQAKHHSPKKSLTHTFPLHLLQERVPVKT